MARLARNKPLSRRVWVGALTALLSVALAAVLFACTQTPTPVPVRTFERAQKVDFVCLQLWQDAGNGVRQTIRPVGRPLADCTTAPAGEDGATYKNQLFALVTQSARGEVAVVNLTTGFIMDVSARVPSAGFLPVGTVPTDIASSPDGEVTFVASADPSKPAIYALPSARILGDKAAVRDDATGAVIGLPADPRGVPTLTSWPSCILPQAPGALTVVPRTPAAPGDPTYELVAVLPGDRTTPAKVVTIDPRPFLRGAGLVAGDAGATAATIAPGSLAPCTLAITSVATLAGEERVPDAFRKGDTWQTGVPYVNDGGAVDTACVVPTRPASCGAPPCCAPKETAPDAAFTTSGIDAGAEVDSTDGGAPIGCAAPETDAGAIPLDLGPLDPPRIVAVARDDATIYVADESLPFVHVLDLSTPGTITERAPLLATSETDPSRVVGVKALAISPPTRDYKKFLYAVDARTGSLLVYDVSAPSAAPRSPLSRPYPELNPFQPPDRVSFSSPVVAVEFARTDIPIRVTDADPTALSGVLCNPNPSLAPTDPGALYRSGSSVRGSIEARSLRGVFAFVTLANGTVAVIDVDDWDAPCRRPAVLAPELAQSSGLVRPFSSIAPAQPSVPGDPYGAPVSAENSTTDEAFFPVSVPHHLRSATLLRASTTSGKQIPYLVSTPTVDRLGTLLPIAGEGSDATPILRPTVEQPVETTTSPGVRFSFEVPEVHVDQDWAVTYEGQIPGFDGFEATLATEDSYQSIELRQPGARFCTKGVEDWETGKARAAQIRGALRRSARRSPEATEAIERRISDYVQLTSDLLGPDDPYWSIGSGTEAGSCWQGVAAAPGRARFDVCNATFGAASDEGLGRDFPILEAYDDRLVLGRFFTFTAGASREVVYKDPSNAAALKLAQCCFHGQARFKVRGGGQWVAVGSAYGFLSHQVAGDGGRCGPSCDPREALLNGRAPAVPRGLANLSVPAVSRDSVLALRNPVFSFFVENGTRRVVEQNLTREVDVPPARNTQWRFSTRGQFQALSVAIGGQSTSVNPQSMRFVGPLGQMAIVDAASQGLVLIDLRTVAIARTPYF